MSYQKIEFASESLKRPNYWKHLIGWCLGLFILGWMVFGHMGAGILLAILGIFPTLYSHQFAHNRWHQSNYELVRSHFIRHGFKPEFELKPMMIIDSQARKIAFFCNADTTYDLLDFSDILGWEHNWVNQTNVDTNVWGDKAISRTRQRHNKLIIQTRNPHQPLYKIFLQRHSDGEAWMAKLNALMHS